MSPDRLGIAVASKNDEPTGATTKRKGITMFRKIAVFALILTLAATQGFAAPLEQTLGTDKQVGSVSPESLMLKDPMIAGLMSISMPGLGQFYTGERKKGLIFFIGTGGALGSAAAFAHPADLGLEDYDRFEYGGNGDGMMSTAELQNWEDDEYVVEAFCDLSTGRQIGTIASAGVGLGLYIWNIIDARKSSRAHNREIIQRRINMRMTASENGTGLALNIHF